MSSLRANPEVDGGFVSIGKLVTRGFANSLFGFFDARALTYSFEAVFLPGGLDGVFSKPVILRKLSMSFSDVDFVFKVDIV